MAMNIYSYMAYGIYFPAETIDYFTFTEQVLPEGLEWFPVGDQSSEPLGTILGVQDSFIDLSNFVGHRYADAHADPVQAAHFVLGWNILLGVAIASLEFQIEEIDPAELGGRWHIAGWVG